MIYLFADEAIPPLSQVGGKGLSLIKMTRHGLPVPGGFVCSLDFFAPWLESVLRSPQWQATREAFASGASLEEPSRRLMASCLQLHLTDTQRLALDRALDTMPVEGFFAVRSSSPEEDLEGASFAGVYETYLGVDRRTIVDALRKAFASAFDERVFVYKIQHGFDPESPKIAVVVQQQIAAQSAGVGFSLNPLNNDYDEAVINANRGLGESVVSGMVTTDQFVINKVDRTIVERQLGGKERAVYLDDRGGTVEREGVDRGSFCIDDEQALDITEMLVRIESIYEMPVDTEWAIADERLYLLQARPITAYVPLAPAMMTRPGERRVLYFDAGLVDTMTINQPMTPLTIDWMFASLDMWITPFIGKLAYAKDSNPLQSVFFAAGARAYLNLSQLLTVVKMNRSSGSKGGGVSQMDDITAKLLAGIDAERYKATEKASSLRWTSLLSHLPAAAIALIPFSWRMLKAIVFPEQVHRLHEAAVGKTIEDLKQIDIEALSLGELIATLNEKLAPVIGKISAPPMSVYMSYMMKYMGNVEALTRDGTPEDRQLAESLTLGFSGNKAAEIGIQLYNMAQMLTGEDLNDLDALSLRIQQRELPPDFMVAWDKFVDEFGFRGPSELELSNPRYGDHPRLALEQMSYMLDSETSPQAIQQRHVVARQQAFDKLLSRLRPRQRRKLRRIYRILDLFGPARDTPKYLWVLDNGMVRRRALLEGERFCRAGRLDHPEDIFWLTLDEIDAANRDTGLDLRALRDSKLPFYQKLEQVVAFPHMIDSRGRIAQVAKQATDDGSLAGISISRGKATGRVKVLMHPREKTVDRGDVLVTYTTDPGWTPLFVNASAIILEVGGMLQHGGVVAREYGKPCVAGIQGITTLLKDGQRVEVDGTNGVVRILEEGGTH